jgi:hypothetical protein
MHTWTKEDAANVLGKPIAVDDNTLPPPRVDSSTPSAPLWTHYGSKVFSGDSGCGCGGCPPDNCFSGCCENGCCYNPGNRWYLSAEALLWWMKGDRTPPLVTTGSATDAVPGALDQPGTRVLFGGNELGTGSDGGGRFLIGYWFTRDHCLGLEASFWFLGTKSSNFSATSTGDPLLFRPFTDETGAQNVELVAVPSPTGQGLNGMVDIRHRTSLWGTEMNFRSNLWCGPNWFIDGLAGFRAMGLDDDLNINESLLLVRGAVINGTTFPDGTSFFVNDRFKTTNRFYGGQVGLDMECRCRNWIFGLKTKLALGATSELAEVTGGTIINVPGQGTSNFNGGLLTQNSNIGRYNRDVFSVVPEVGVSVGYQFNEHWRASLGYNFLYWSNVARAGEQIDTVVNRNQLPPPIATADRPAFAFHGTSFWAQGITLGLEFKW